MRKCDMNIYICFVKCKINMLSKSLQERSVAMYEHSICIYIYRTWNCEPNNAENPYNLYICLGVYPYVYIEFVHITRAERRWKNYIHQNWDS